MVEHDIAVAIGELFAPVCTGQTFLVLIQFKIILTLLGTGNRSTAVLSNHRPRKIKRYLFEEAEWYEVYRYCLYPLHESGSLNPFAHYSQG